MFPSTQWTVLVADLMLLSNFLSSVYFCMVRALCLLHLTTFSSFVVSYLCDRNASESPIVPFRRGCYHFLYKTLQCLMTGSLVDCIRFGNRYRMCCVVYQLRTMFLIFVTIVSCSPSCEVWMFNQPVRQYYILICNVCCQLRL